MEQVVEVGGFEYSRSGKFAVERGEIGEEEGAVYGDGADVGSVVFAGEPAVWHCDEEFAAGFEDAVNFVGGAGEVGDMLEGFEGHDGVEVVVGKIHRRGGHVLEVESRVGGSFFCEGVEVFLLDVDAVDFAVVFGEVNGECAVATAEVEEAFACPIREGEEFLDENRDGFGEGFVPAVSGYGFINHVIQGKPLRGWRW